MDRFSDGGPGDDGGLILKRSPLGWNQNDFDVVEDGIIVGRIFFLDAVGPTGRPWMWASGHNGHIKRAAYGYEPTREAAMPAFAKSWRGQRREAALPCSLAAASARKYAKIAYRKIGWA